MTFPEPVAGLVIRYAYLWRDEFLAGREEGAKDRPCAIILAVRITDDETRVFALPITHAAPSDPDDGLEIPHETKSRLGLDDAQSWIVLTEANEFVWPGPDLRPAKPGGDPSDIVYGPLPKKLFERMRDGFVRNLSRLRAKTIPRS
jgi:hypothetical protein